MLPKSIERLALKLKQKKQRHKLKLFIAEGEKTIEDLLQVQLQPLHLLCTDERFSNQATYVQVDARSMQQLSSLETADGCLAIFPFPNFESEAREGLSLVLDNIRIPGNLGTIIRSADWFGVQHIYCTTGTADCFNAKCVQSSMGSIGRVQLHYASADEIHAELKNHRLFVADMRGTDARQLKLDPAKPTALIMGSESHGPSAFWKANAEAVTISRKGDSPIESLNVAMATAILLHQLS